MEDLATECIHMLIYGIELKMFGGDVYLPSDWEGTKLFNLDYKIIEDDDLRLDYQSNNGTL